MEIQKILNSEGIHFLDGAMGTMLQKKGLPLGERPESLCLEAADEITEIHKEYIGAGSQIVYTNTFGANRYKLAGTGMEVKMVIEAAVNCAKQAAKGTDTLVALDIGPIGELLEPSGTLSFEEAYECFKEMVAAGEQAGCDLVVFETMTDLYEMKAGVLAAHENSKLPVFCTMTFEENGRTFTGCTVEAMAVVLEGLGVDAVGINCSLGPKEIYPLAERLANATSLPIIIKANAGLPDPLTNQYDITPEQFGKYMKAYGELGVKFMGGCCGTTPEFIVNIRNSVQNVTVVPVKRKRKTVLCSPSHMVVVDGVRVIGERINPTGKKRFQQALKEGDLAYVATKAIEQEQAGADILDVNVGVAGINEKEMMIKVVKTLQSVCDLPLQIDSSDAEAIEAGLRVYNGKAIVNSVNGETEKLDTILPIVKKYGAAVVGLTMDKDGIPESAQKRVEIAQRILDRAIYYGIPKEDVMIDCLTLTVSAQQDQAKETLQAVRRVTEELGLHTMLGVSNISFGLPQRRQITISFLTAAMTNGLKCPIVNPNQQEIMDAIVSFRVLSQEDVNGEAYIERFANRTDEEKKESEQKNENESLSYAVSKGLKEDVVKITKELLKTKSEMEIINELLIPTLDDVGEKYESQKIFLPQLIQSAEASCKAFEVLKKSIASKGTGSVMKGKIVLATVKGDIHDIGKNIVKVILENYGYQVIDLGKDVAVETVVETVQKEEIHFVGLSALMTTTLVSMKKTVEALHAAGLDCKIVVGGAVLTEEYAHEIGADFYAKDAKQTVDFAKQVLG